MSELKIPIMLTIDETFNYLEQKAKENKVKNYISKYYIREKARAGEIANVKSGKKYLINLEKFIEHLNNSYGVTPEQVKPTAQIKPIKV